MGKYMKGTRNVIINMAIVILALISTSMLKSINASAIGYESSVRIAKWKGNKKAVLTLYFDDSSPGQATLAIPALNKRNIVGTWFVNPGRYYKDYINNWENIAPAGGQELANHSMHHRGAKDHNETVYEVGEAAKIIWRIRKQDEHGSLIAFQRGGGTKWWSQEDLKQVLIDFNCIDREDDAGEIAIDVGIAIGSNADVMFDSIPKIISDGIWGRILFHGISPTKGTKDFGLGAVWYNDFEIFLDRLVNVSDKLWFGGYMQVYKYIKERDSSKISIIQNSKRSLTIELKSGMDPKYYDEPLTIMANVPKNWKNCIVVQEGVEKEYAVNKGIVMFDARPNLNPVFLRKK